MIFKSILMVEFSVAFVSVASVAWAMDSDNTDRPPAPPGDYELGVKAVRAGNYAAALWSVRMPATRMRGISSATANVSLSGLTRH